MSQATVTWRFTAAVSADRIAALSHWVAFDSIVVALLFASIEKFWWETYFMPSLKGCKRASFTIKVATGIYDAFFNSPNGYRGQYARAPTIGEAANRSLLNALESKLLDAEPLSRSNVDLNLVRRSLRATDAKVWIDEDEVEEQLTSEAPAISYPLWEHHDLNSQGLRAPVGTLLEVKGGWIDANGEEKRDSTKASRSLHIFERGYS